MSTQNNAVEVNTVLYHWNSHSKPVRNLPSLWIKARILDYFAFVYSINLTPIVLSHLILIFSLKKPHVLKNHASFPCCDYQSNLQIDFSETRRGSWATVNNVGLVPAITVYRRLYLHCQNTTVFPNIFLLKPWWLAETILWHKRYSTAACELHWPVNFTLNTGTKQKFSVPVQQHFCLKPLYANQTTNNDFSIMLC